MEIAVAVAVAAAAAETTLIPSPLESPSELPQRKPVDGEMNEDTTGTVERDQPSLVDSRQDDCNTVSVDWKSSRLETIDSDDEEPPRSAGLLARGDSGVKIASGKAIINDSDDDDDDDDVEQESTSGQDSGNSTTMVEDQQPVPADVTAETADKPSKPKKLTKAERLELAKTSSELMRTTVVELQPKVKQRSLTDFLSKFTRPAVAKAATKVSTLTTVQKEINDTAITVSADGTQQQISVIKRFKAAAVRFDLSDDDEGILIVRDKQPAAVTVNNSAASNQQKSEKSAPFDRKEWSRQALLRAKEVESRKRQEHLRHKMEQQEAAAALQETAAKAFDITKNSTDLIIKQENGGEEEEEEEEFSVSDCSSSDESNGVDEEDDDEDMNLNFAARSRPRKAIAAVVIGSDDEDDDNEKEEEASIRDDVTLSDGGEDERLSMEFMPTAPPPTRTQPEKVGKEVRIAPIFSMMQRIKDKAASVSEELSPPKATANSMDEESNLEPLQFRFDPSLLLPDDENTMHSAQPMADHDQSDAYSPLSQTFLSASQANALLQQSAKLMDMTQDSVLNQRMTVDSGSASQTLVSALRLEMERIRQEGKTDYDPFAAKPLTSRRLVRASDVINSERVAEELENDDYDDEDEESEGDYDSGSAASETGDEDVDGSNKEGTAAPEQSTAAATTSAKRSNFLEAEAEVEEDENMHLGGMDGDALEAEKALREELAAFIDEDDESLKTLTLEELQHRVKQNESVWRLFNEQQRESEFKETKELVKDIATGKILDKRKHKINIDPSTAAELVKFGRAEDDDERNTGSLRELDDVKDYGMFGDLIGRVLAEQRSKRSAHRKRKHLAEAEDGKQNAATDNQWTANGEDDFDWTNDGTAAGGVSLGPGEFIETDLDKLEERVKRRTLLQQLRNESGDFNGSWSAKIDVNGTANSMDSNDDAILRMIRRKRPAVAPPRPAGKESSGGVAPLAFSSRLKLSADIQKENTIEMKDLSPTSLARYKTAMGISDDEWKRLDLGGNASRLAKGKSGFIKAASGKKFAAFSVSRAAPSSSNQ